MYFSKELIDNISQAYNQIIEHFDVLKEELRCSDLLIQDLLHAIENDTFNVVKGYHYAKKIQKIQQARRLIKNEYEIFQSIYPIIAKNQKDLKKITEKIEKRIEDQKNRTYTPRITDFKTDTNIKPLMVNGKIS
ncbi:hypothetical protein [Petroclostridium sp. X23]|uniref:hypothetical protein n=1 Tax=Petroclostridium sp. X23 TaxID=3045146 RepID=UPI0024ADAC88|nr:hypothetical protein [Petroclostridium sp. X23]WHH60976.1 hypothetical protein QKW49_09830 [Petroclostridium sp. X23]